MTEHQVKVANVVAEELGAQSVDLTQRLRDDLGCDSLDSFNLVMALEEKFGIVIGEADIAELQTVQQVADYIEQKLLPKA